MLVLAAVFLLMSGASAGAATTFTDCTNCHTSVNFAVQPLSRTTECYTCHLGASHASWDDGSGGKTTAVFVAQRGYFKTVDSYNSSPDVLHTAHAGTNRYANSSGCGKCHQTAACTACHNNVSHNQHSLTGKPSLPGYTAPSFLQADGITDPPKSVAMSCALSQCHQQMPGVVRTNFDGSALCVNCHTGGGHNHNVSATGYDANPQANCGSCHATNPDQTTAELATIHQRAANAGKIANYSCNTCHNPTFVGSVIGDGALDMMRSGRPIYCADCHDGTKAHAVNHQPDHQSTGNENVTCNVCHDGTTVKGSFNAPTGTAVDVSAAAIHTDCNKCHATTNTTVQNFISASKGQLNPVYQCNVCHDTITPKHNKLHTVKSYLTGSADTSCASCHSNGDVAALHSGTTAAGKVLNCDTCHSGAPALPNTVSTIKANLSSNTARAGYTCQDCHSDISGGHNHAVTASGYAAAPNVDCGACHATGTAKTAELATIHKQAADAGKIANYGCATCHNSTFVGAVIGDGSLDMLRNSKPIYCADCHDGVKADSITDTAAAKPTKYPEHNGTHDKAAGFGTYAWDSNVDCSKCHTSMDIAPVHDSAKNPVACNACHTRTDAVSTVIAKNLSRKTSTPNFTCADCHNTLPNKHAYEHKATSAEIATLDCTGCHSAAAWTNNTAGVAEVHNNNCNTCHASTNSVVSSFITGKKGIVNPIYSCEGCHTTEGALAKETAHQPEHQAKHSATGMTCSSCHNFSVAAATPADIKSTTIHKNGCNTCHGSAVRNDVKLVIAAKLKLANPVYTCEECHGTIHAGWDAKHKPTFPADPTMTCSSCNNNYLPTEHEKALSPSTNSAVGYKVFRSTSGTGPWTEIGSTTATSFANTGLTANTSYYYKVQAYDGKPNYSGDSNIASVKTLANTAVVSTVNPDAARYATGNNGDSAADPTSTTDVRTKLTDNSTGTYSTVRENGSSDQYIFVKINKDAGDYTNVELKLSVRYYNGTNLTIYPYSTDTAINTNTAYTVDGLSRSSSSSYITETIDVTKAANAMNGLGWMKFRIKPDPAKSASVYIANVQVVLTQSPTSGGTATNPPGTLTSTPGDTTAPSAPTGLAGTANYYDRVDLTWTASTDTGSAAGDSCAVCHSAAALQPVKDAIAAKNANCSACHAIHADINTVHTGNALPTTPWQCSGCHTNVLSIEHSAGATLKNNASLNCDTCHKSTLAKVQAAINSTVTDKSNLRCEACHTGTADGVPVVHADLAAPHLTAIFPTATDATCLNCHTTQAADFVSSKGGYHAVNGLTSKAATEYGTYVSPWTATSQVGCKGCHGSNNDGKSQAANILKRPYTYLSNSGDSSMLCYLCHDYNTYGGGGSSTGKTGFSDSSNLHNIGDHMDSNNRIQCSWCHSAVPHATNKAHLIVTKTDPNAQGNVLTSFTHPASGQYQVSSCGSDVSLCDEHR